MWIAVALAALRCTDLMSCGSRQDVGEVVAVIEEGRAVVSAAAEAAEEVQRMKKPSLSRQYDNLGLKERRAAPAAVSLVACF